MPDDALESVLRLVAEGRLSAEEAGPILDAIEARTSPPASGDRDRDPGTDTDTRRREPGRAIRLEVTENGRKVVNLRVPLALGRAALARVPGLSEATTDRIREAIEAGITGPIVHVDEGSGDGVRIVIE
jgi:outer membrane receptor protein involved in Fe transport